MLSGKTALITGHAQGIGAAIAEAFSREGAAVIGVDQKTSSEHHLKQSVTADLSDTASLSGLVDSLVAEHGVIDLFVSAAGICPTLPLMDCEPTGWLKVFDVNVHAPFFLMQALAGHLIDQGRSGSFIQLASISAFLPKIEQVAYGASKAAVVSLTRSSAAVFGPHNIRVNAIAPGVIDTPLTQSIAQARAAIRNVPPSETQRPVIEATPLRRIGNPAEVAELAVFLGSDSASFITGQTIDVCGGLLMR